jgi:hypothetical protein
MKNCHSYKTEHHQILRFLCVHVLTPILLVGGLGVEVQQNDPHVIFLRVVRPTRRSTHQNQEHLMNWNKKFQVLLLLLVLNS